MSVLFEAGSADLYGAAREELATVATELLQSNDRIQLRGFGGAAGDKSWVARRLSLKRALAVRAFLIDQGVTKTRIDVRALGGARDKGPADRVDITMATP